MGLLSDPNFASVKMARKLKQYSGAVCALLYIGALVWFLMLGNKDFNNQTYFSENALLPGLVTNEFNGEHNAKQFFNEFLQELEDKYSVTHEMPVPWLVAKMSQVHLEVYTHNFTLNYPLGQGQVYKGTNVYGILRAPRTASLEAIVISAPFRPLGSHEKPTAAGIALMLAFAQFARPQKYWAKDIIFLVTEHEQLGMQAWLEAYHGLQSDTESFYTSLGSFWPPGGMKWEKKLSQFGWTSSHQKSLNPGKLKGRSGSIQAAINLEIHDPKLKYIEVKIEGLNGQLPNLDLVNLVHKLCVKSGIHHAYRNSYSWINIYDKMSQWQSNIWTMLGMVFAQLPGVPTGNHGLFHRFGIEAVTLEGRDAYDLAGPAPKVHSLNPCNFYRLGVALESILRSINNLLERFHQSYFFYLLAATNRFISIGQYIPSLCAICLAMLVQALSLWVTIQEEYEDDEQTDKKEKPKRKTKTSESEVPGDHENEETAVKHDETTLRRRKTSEADMNVPGDKEYTESKKTNEKNEKHKQKSKSSETKELGDQENIDTVLGKEDTTSKSETKNGKKVKESKDKEAAAEEPSMSVVNIGVNYLLVHLIGYAVMNSPELMTNIGTIYFDANSEVSVFYGLVGVSVFLTIVSPFFPRLLRLGRISREEMTLVNILVLIELTTLCLGVGMNNFPLGFIMAVVYAPLAMVARVVVEDGKRRLILLTFKRALCLLLHPLSIISLSMIAYSRYLVPEEKVLANANRGLDAAMQAIMFSIVDSMIYGNWLFNVVSAVLFPIWIIFWQILCLKVDAQQN